MVGKNSKKAKKDVLKWIFKKELTIGEMEIDVPSKNHFLFPKSRMWFIGIAFLVVLVSACLIVGFVASEQARKTTEAKYEKLKQEQSATTTASAASAGSTPKLSPTTSKPPCTEPWCEVRLPTSIIPYHYNLYIETDPPNVGYNGVQVVFLNITQPIDVVLFHIKLLEVTNVSLSKIGSVKPLLIEKSFTFPENEYYVIKFESKIPVGTYQLEVHFKSNVSDILTGFYRSAYVERDDSKRVLFTTKFQPTDARKAFPCLDEPNLKATFNIEIIHPQNYHARSNMPGVSVNISNNRTSTKFNQTVKMSTYLVCYVVSQFEMKYSGAAGKDNHFEISVWSRPEYVNSTEYSFNTSVNMMNFLEQFLNVKYPMPKLDMYGIPDYASGATEHWGIITYRESRLLYTPGVSSLGNMKSTAGIIGHECAHLWFGNLVTCAWWNDLWIQEGLASYLEYYAMNSSHPEWKMFDEFLISDWLTGITLDSLASSHPISQRVDHPSQIKEIFDSITYNKGSSLFHMLDFYLDSTHDLFRNGLNRYLVEYQYRGATSNDLWNMFTKAAGWNVTEMMDTWTQQMGFPVIDINKTDSGKFTIRQSHFLVDPMAVVTQKSKFNYQWIVPFTYATSDNLASAKTKLIREKSEFIESNAPWMIGNFQHRGFYRVNYDANGWKMIIDQLSRDFTVFSVTDRAGIIDDAFNLARSGRLSYSTVFSLLSFIEKDDNDIVWRMVLSNLNYLGKVLSSTNVYSRYRGFVAKKIKPMVQKKFNSYVSAACQAGETETIDKVKTIFKAWMKNDTTITADIRSAVLYYGVENGGDAEWDFVFEKFQNASDPSDRSRFQSALAASQKPWILKKWLDYSIDGKTIRTQDTVYVISNVASNPVGKYVAWAFAEANWNKIISIAKENNFHVNQFISGITELMSTPYELQQVEELWAIHSNERDGVNARQQSLEKIKSNIYWLRFNYEEVSQWLQRNVVL